MTTLQINIQYYQGNFNMQPYRKHMILQDSIVFQPNSNETAVSKFQHD